LKELSWKLASSETAQARKSSEGASSTVASAGASSSGAAAHPAKTMADAPKIAKPAKARLEVIDFTYVFLSL
jgi:hypothetical protein